MKLIVTSLSLVVAAGCTGTLGGPAEAPHARLELTGEAGELRLSGTTLDGSYAATYDNPRDIATMKVVVGPRGKLVGVCKTEEGVVVSCGDVPFFSRVRTNGTERIVEAWDLHGELVVSYSCSDAFDDVCTSAEEEEDRAEEECGDDHGGDDVGDGDGDDVGDGGDGDGDGDCDGDCDNDCPPRPDDCAALEDWARDCFCTKVNESIDDVGLDHTVDCGGLDSDEEFEEFDDDYEGDLACGNDIIDEPEEEVEDEIDETDCEDVEGSLHNWASQVDHQLRSGGMCGHSPLILDLAGDGIALSDLSGGTRFDLLGTGSPVDCAWIQDDDAFLVLDRDDSGTIDGAAELFGNATGGRSFANGFAALAELDADGNGRIDVADPMFGALRVWNDPDRDGVGTASELRTLDEVGVTSLSLGAERVTGKAAWDGRGNRIPLTSAFARASGGGALVDAFLRYAPSEQADDTSSLLASGEPLTCELDH